MHFWFFFLEMTFELHFWNIFKVFLNRTDALESTAVQVNIYLKKTMNKLSKNKKVFMRFSLCSMSGLMVKKIYTWVTTYLADQIKSPFEQSNKLFRTLHVFRICCKCDCISSTCPLLSTCTVLHPQIFRGFFFYVLNMFRENMDMYIIKIITRHDLDTNNEEAFRPICRRPKYEVYLLDAK